MTKKGTWSGWETLGKESENRTWGYWTLWEIVAEKRIWGGYKKIEQVYRSWNS